MQLCPSTMYKLYILQQCFLTHGSGPQVGSRTLDQFLTEPTYFA